MKETGKRRVVATGLGAITPLGATREAFWEGLVAGRSGVGPITAFDASPLRARIAAEIRDFDPDTALGRRDARRMDRYAQLAMVAADEALADASIPDDPQLRNQIGVVVGTGIGGIVTIQETTFKVAETQDISRISPFFVPMLMANAAPAQISMKYGFRGPLYAVSSACASANDAIIAAYETIVRGDAEMMVTGGTEATITSIAVGGFDSMKALSSRNDEPERASRPFDRDRDGFVLGEGAGIIVLEERERALRRGAKIYGEMLGYGQSADAYNLVAVDPDGLGVTLALERALASAALAPGDVDYINAHGTSTPIGDPAESKAIEKVWGEAANRVAVSSTKSMHG
ncbi:MAG: beta-ketoacyl-ACP synthase II, partial [Candidatus Eremiobacteraeota bacterium]|nr:beta-ketoacyl-ACP synthase II [Candidatus Eremiobacteraeota bacterium]